MSGGRNKGGQFSKGNGGGPGRPRRAIEADYLKALTTSVALDDWRAVVARAVEDAKNGDPRARDWLSRYLVGSEPIAAEPEQEQSSIVILRVPDNGRGPARDEEGRILGSNES